MSTDQALLRFLSWDNILHNAIDRYTMHLLQPYICGLHNPFLPKFLWISDIFNWNLSQIVCYYRQGGKDQTKKGPNVKLGPQGEKKGLGQDSRKDSSLDSGHHSKVRTYSAVMQYWYLRMWICWMSLCAYLPAGGAHEHARKNQAGAGCHQTAPLLHPAVSAGAGLPSH